MACDVARHSVFQQIQGKGYICHIKLAIIFRALISLGFTLVYFYRLCFCCTPFCSAAVVLWGSASFILQNLCLAPSEDKYIMILKTCIAPIFYFIYLLCKTLKKECEKVSHCRFMKISYCFSLQLHCSINQTSKYLSINSCVSTVPSKNCEKTYCEKSNPTEVSQERYTIQKLHNIFKNL